MKHLPVLRAELIEAREAPFDRLRAHFGQRLLLPQPVQPSLISPVPPIYCALLAHRALESAYFVVARRGKAAPAVFIARSAR